MCSYYICIHLHTYTYIFIYAYETFTMKHTFGAKCSLFFRQMPALEHIHIWQILMNRWSNFYKVIEDWNFVYIIESLSCEDTVEEKVIYNSYESAMSRIKKHEHEHGFRYTYSHSRGMRKSLTGKILKSHATLFLTFLSFVCLSWLLEIWPPDFLEELYRILFSVH